MTAVSVSGLRQYLRPARAREPTPERCDLCATEIPSEHSHLVDVRARSLRCACRPCALLFADRPREAMGGFFRTVPDRWLHDPAFTLSDTQWDALQIPVGLAFFLRSGDDGTVTACYPGPAGATESELDLARFDEGVGAGALAETLEPDVEALLVRHDDQHDECLLVPVDACYQLVGLVRTHWKGFDGGAEAWAHIEAFFAAARRRARSVTR